MQRYFFAFLNFAKELFIKPITFLEQYFAAEIAKRTHEIMLDVSQKLIVNFSIDLSPEELCDLSIQMDEGYREKKVFTAVVKKVLFKPGFAAEFLDQIDALVKDDSPCDLISKMPISSTYEEYIRVVIKFWVSKLIKTSAFSDFFDCFEIIRSKEQIYKYCLTNMTDSIVDLIVFSVCDKKNFEDSIEEIELILSALNGLIKEFKYSHKNLSFEFGFVREIFFLSFPEKNYSNNFFNYKNDPKHSFKKRVAKIFSVLKYEQIESRRNFLCELLYDTVTRK